MSAPISSRSPTSPSRPPSRTIAAGLRSFWQQGRTWERVGYVVGALLLASGLMHLGILAIGGSSWQGPVSLRKPMTFGLSFGLTLITVVWVSTFLRLGDRRRTILLGTLTVACVVETMPVSVQAWRGVPSHYNVETALDASIARTLAAGGFAIIATIVSLTYSALRAQAALRPSLRVGIRVGLLSLCASLAVGAAMIAKGMQLVFAGTPQIAYATGGTLKPTHAVTMHGVLVLPLLAWLLSFTNWTERRRLRIVRLCAAAYVLLIALVLIGNIAGSW